jgi:hypothetical protein
MNRTLQFQLVALILLLSGATLATPVRAQTPTESKPTATAEGVVRELYRVVTTKPGGPTPDWEYVRSLFLKEAVIVLRSSREATSIFTVQGFLDDFASFNERARVKERGFTETIVRLKPTVFRDIAHVLVLYEASIPGLTRPPQQGVDSIQLIRKDGRWWIASITNDLPTAEAPLPAELR